MPGEFLLFHLLTTAVKLAKPGGCRSIIAENLLLKQQLIIHSRARQIILASGLDLDKDSLWSIDLFRAESITNEDTLDYGQHPSATTNTICITFIDICTSL